jgi:3,4-dihydroxy 2-butanone 4-phosphate synthase/GTP cyclohydrolase II
MMNDMFASANESLGPPDLRTALEAFRNGDPVIVTDAGDREDEGDVMFAADAAATELMAFLIRHSSGIVCVAMDQDDLVRLDLPPMADADRATDPRRTAFTQSVDAALGTTTGVSAKDRALTARTLGSPEARPADFNRPGHVFPLRAHEGRVTARAGHTEAGLELGRLAGKPGAAVLAEAMNRNGAMMRGESLRAFAERHAIPMLTIERLIAARRSDPRQVVVRRIPVVGDLTAHNSFYLSVKAARMGHLIPINAGRTAADIASRHSGEPA